MHAHTLKCTPIAPHDHHTATTTTTTIIKPQPQYQAREDDLEETVGLTLATKCELEELRSRFMQVLTENTSLKQQLGILEAATGVFRGVFFRGCFLGFFFGGGVFQGGVFWGCGAALLSCCALSIMILPCTCFTTPPPPSTESHHQEISTLQDELTSVRSYAESLSQSVSIDLRRSFHAEGSSMLIGAGAQHALSPHHRHHQAAPTPSSCASDARAPALMPNDDQNKENDPMSLRRSVSTAAQLQGAAVVLMGGMPMGPASPSSNILLGRTESAPTAGLLDSLPVRPYTGNSDDEIDDNEVDDDIDDDGGTIMSSGAAEYMWREEITMSVVAHKGTPLAERLKGLLDSEPSSPVRALGF